MLNELKTAKKVVGVNQVRKALNRDLVKKTFLAKNADPMLTEAIAGLCSQKQVFVIWVDSMAELGAACGIAVGAAAAGILE